MSLLAPSARDVLPDQPTCYISVMEMQTILTALMENFRLAYPAGMEIRRAVGAVVTPLVRGKESEGAQMPLHVTPL